LGKKSTELIDFFLAGFYLFEFVESVLLPISEFKRAEKLCKELVFFKKAGIKSTSILRNGFGFGASEMNIF